MTEAEQKLLYRAEKEIRDRYTTAHGSGDWLKMPQAMRANLAVAWVQGYLAAVREGMGKDEATPKIVMEGQ